MKALLQVKTSLSVGLRGAGGREDSEPAWNQYETQILGVVKNDLFRERTAVLPCFRTLVRVRGD